MDDATTELDICIKRSAKHGLVATSKPWRLCFSRPIPHRRLGNYQDRASWLAYAAVLAGLATRVTFADVTTRIIGDLAVVSGTFARGLQSYPSRSRRGIPFDPPLTRRARGPRSER
jgi:hypothetical protein